MRVEENRCGALTIGSVTLPNTVLLAPMSGVTDLPFRRIAHRFGAGLVISEMVASDALAGGHRDTCLRAQSGDLSPHVVQLAGREAHWMAEGARIAAAAGADIIDINMGCPSKRVTTGYSGSALMRDLDHALTLIDATVAAVDLPVTVKMRLGWDESSVNAPDLAKRAETSGVQMITVHGRTRCQFYKGKANWSAIRAVSEAVDIPVIANGDCMNAADADALLEKSGAQGVMVGRASYGRPWLAGNIARSLAGKSTAAPLEGSALSDLIIEHYEGMLAHYGSKIGIRAARKHLSWYMETTSSGQTVPADVRQTMLTGDNPEQIIQLAKSWFGDAQVRSAA
ncbi:MAG: tRNA dihydrouridine synthase DusB [Stappiaceae bacterium]